MERARRTVRLDDEEWAALGAYADTAGLPSASAIRHLMSIGLGTERLSVSLAALSALLEHLFQQALEQLSLSRLLVGHVGPSFLDEAGNSARERYIEIIGGPPTRATTKEG